MLRIRLAAANRAIIQPHLHRGFRQIYSSFSTTAADAEHYTQHRTYRAGVPRVHPETPECNAQRGRVRYSWKRSFWGLGNSAAFLVGAWATTSGFAGLLEGTCVFFATTGVSVLFGHSLGMHRLWIHRSYETYKPIEYAMVHLGVLMGIAGPIGMAKAHDLRDWAQRQPPGECHPYYSQQSSFWKDAYYQLHCEMQLDAAPRFEESPDMRDPVMQWMERTWMWQQAGVGTLLFAVGGLPYVVWGVCARVMASTHGHFFVGWWAHNNTEVSSQNYSVEGAACQGYNVKGWPGLSPKLNNSTSWTTTLQAVMCAGENYHANHHAFPGSAKLSLREDELDIGWKTLKLMERLGLVWNLRLPEDLPKRSELRKIH